MKLTYEVNKVGTKLYTNAKGQRHRKDGPAAEYVNGDKAWYVNDKLHRTDGPAVEYADGDKTWYVNDKELTEAQFNERTKPVVKAVKAKLQTIEIDGVTYKLVKA